MSTVTISIEKYNIKCTAKQNIAKVIGLPCFLLQIIWYIKYEYIIRVYTAVTAILNFPLNCTPNGATTVSPQVSGIQYPWLTALACFKNIGIHGKYPTICAIAIIINVIMYFFFGIFFFISFLPFFLFFYCHPHKCEFLKIVYIGIVSHL